MAANQRMCRRSSEHTDVEEAMLIWAANLWM
jgi:hypothetical protein